VSIEQSVTSSSGAAEVSAIENEIPAYRAIAPQAVFSLIFGVLAVLGFASWFFLSFAALAVLLGVMANRRIKQLPDVLTGGRLAQAGIGLGLVFGLTAVSIGSVQYVIRGQQAKAFALKYEKALQTGTFEELVWYMQPPRARESRSPKDLVAEMKKGPEGMSSFQMQTETIHGIHDQVTNQGADVHFKGIESHGDQDNDMYAGALYEVHSPKAKDPADRERLALAHIKTGKNSKGKTEWYVVEIRYPYQPTTFVVAPKPVDDGHGHGPGGH
jgi:hypothetical protein